MVRSHRKKTGFDFVVAYNAERTIQEVIRRIPPSLALYDTEVLIIDDSSRDQTFDRAHDLERTGEAPFPLTVLHNPVNQGYGGNQKIGFRYAMRMDSTSSRWFMATGQY